MPWTCLRHGKYGALARLVAGRWAPHHEAPSQAAPLVVCFLAHGPPQLLRAAAAGCCGLLRAAAGSAAGAATSVFCFPGLVGCVRCRNWLGGMRFSSLLVFTTTSTLLLFLLLLNLLFQVRNSFTNAQERSIPTYCTTAASGDQPPLFPLLSCHHNIAKCQVSPSAAPFMSQLASHIDTDNTMSVTYVYF